MYAAGGDDGHGGKSPVRTDTIQQKCSLLHAGCAEQLLRLWLQLLPQQLLKLLCARAAVQHKRMCLPSVLEALLGEAAAACHADETGHTKHGDAVPEVQLPALLGLTGSWLGDLLGWLGDLSPSWLGDLPDPLLAPALAGAENEIAAINGSAAVTAMMLPAGHTLLLGCATCFGQLLLLLLCR